jgi:predicted metal-binding membrane protein
VAAALPLAAPRPRWDLAVASTGFAIAIVLAWHGQGHMGATTQSLHAGLETAALMAAMMTPLAAPSAAVVAECSLRRSRLRTVAEHTAGFAALWFVVSIVAVGAVRLVSLLVASTLVFAAALLVAAGWRASSTRRRYLRRCGRVRVSAPTGWPSHAGALAAGVDQAVACVRTCWAAMLAMAAAPGLSVMLVVLGVNLSEWAPGVDPVDTGRRRREVAAYGAMAAATIVVALSR